MSRSSCDHPAPNRVFSWSLEDGGASEDSHISSSALLHNWIFWGGWTSKPQESQTLVPGKECQAGKTVRQGFAKCQRNELETAKTGRKANPKRKPTKARFTKENSSSTKRQARVNRCDCKRKTWVRCASGNLSSEFQFSQVYLWKQSRETGKHWRDTITVCHSQTAWLNDLFATQT